MSDSLQLLRRKIEGAGEVASVVSAMKAVAASSITQYECAVAALSDYYRTIELGLSLCFRSNALAADLAPGAGRITGVIVFGSDQGMVGQFNDELAAFVGSQLAVLPGEKEIWVCGLQMQESLANKGFAISGHFDLPASIDSINPLIVAALSTIEPHLLRWQGGGLYLLNNRPIDEAVFEPVSRKILPFDGAWLKARSQTVWPTKKLPEIVGDAESAFVREYLFISIYQACAESLAGENACRLAAMQRAEKNVADLLTRLNQTYRRLRQSSIDEEMFDVISGFEALPDAKKRSVPGLRITSEADSDNHVS